MKTIELQAIFSMSIVVLTSYLYYHILGKINKVKIEGTKSNLIQLFFLRKLVGFLILGLIPYLLAHIFFDFKLKHERLMFESINYWWVWILVVSALLIFLNFMYAKSPVLRAVYPELRLQNWTIGSLGMTATGWLIYLVGYEYLFRGILLSACSLAFGAWPAIAINLALYSSMHLYKSLNEAIAAIPFGAFLCYITIESNSILPAILIHSLQAISCEIACIYRNKEMTISINKNIL